MKQGRVSESKKVGKEDRMSVVTVREKGQLTIPAEIREAARLEAGDPVVVEIVAEGILLRPKKMIDATQAWFWTLAWQEGEREASAELAAGRGKTYDTDEAFLESFGS